MMIHIKKDETLLYSIEADNVVDKNEKIADITMLTVVALFGVSGGEAPIKFNLSLTNKNLYLEAIGISSWGRLPETRYVEKIRLKDIHEFSVKLDGQYEEIYIEARKNVKLHLRRNNQNVDNIAQKISETIFALEEK